MSAFHHTVKTVTPFHDRSRHSRLLKIALWLIGIAVVLAICHAAGFDVIGWFDQLWDTMTEISIGYIVAGVGFQTIQTTLTALAWYYILAAGYPDGGVRYRDILAAYSAGVAMNGFLPANIGTFASLLMYVALIHGSTFPGVLGATVTNLRCAKRSVTCGAERPPFTGNNLSRYARRVRKVGDCTPIVGHGLEPMHTLTSHRAYGGIWR